MNDKFFKKNLPIAVLSTAMVSSILVACSKKEDIALKDSDSSLSFSEENEPNLNLAERGDGVSYNANGVSADGKYQPAELVNDVYQIANAGNLYWFAKFVNEGNGDANAILTADINLQWGLSNDEFNAKFLNQVIKFGLPDVTDDNFIKSIKNWTPIGGTSDYGSYNGNFNGNGHTITGIYCVLEDGVFAGLFGAPGRGAKIQNVKVENSFFELNSKEYFRCMGAIAGYAFGEVEISNCQANNVCLRDNELTGECLIGGILGQNENSVVTNCSSVAKIECTKATKAGGLCGVVASDAKLENSETFVQIIVLNDSSSGNLGHICGLVFSSNAKVENCSYVSVEGVNESMSDIGECYLGKVDTIKEIGFDEFTNKPHRILVIQMQ